MPYRYTDPGAIYSLCKCAKTPTLRWDPHPECMFCIYRDHYVEALRDLDREGEPECTFCKRLRRCDRARWVAQYKKHVLDPAANHVANANASTYVPVANLQQVPLDHMAASYDGGVLHFSGVVGEHHGEWGATPDGEYDALSYMPTGEEPGRAMCESNLDGANVGLSSKSLQLANAAPANTQDGAAPQRGPNSLSEVFSQVFQRAFDRSDFDSD